MFLAGGGRCQQVFQQVLCSGMVAAPGAGVFTRMWPQNDSLWERGVIAHHIVCLGWGEIQEPAEGRGVPNRSSPFSRAFKSRCTGTLVRDSWLFLLESEHPRIHLLGQPSFPRRIEGLSRSMHTNTTPHVVQLWCCVWSAL